jgi:hypothetical protein
MTAHNQEYQVRHFAHMADFATALKSLPAEVMEHYYSYASFGGWWVIVRCRGISFRVAFDGREGQLSVERSSSRKPPYKWDGVVWEGPIRTDAESDLSDAIGAIRKNADTE